MTCNVAGADKTVRFIVGGAALLSGFLAPLETTWKVVLFAVAGVAFVTATVGFCPLNKLLGVDTCKKAGSS